MKIKPVLNPNDYKSKDGTYPIYIRVNVGKKRTLIPVGVKIKKDEWDPKSGRVKIDRRANGGAINLSIIELCNSIEKNHLQGGSVESGDKDSFYWWFQERIDYAKKHDSVYHWKKLKSVQDKLKEFSPILPVKKLDYKFLIDFEGHLKDQVLQTKSRQFHTNTIADIMTRIRTIMTIVIKSNKIAVNENPFLHYKIKTIRTIKKRITKDGIDKLLKANFKHSDIQMAVNIYLLSFFTGGTRFGDCCRLEKIMVHAGRLKYVQHKSIKGGKLQPRDIILLPQALKILKRLKSKSKYIFDINVDWKNEDLGINARNTYFNPLLKEACRKLEIEEVTFHTSKNSFIDWAIKKGIDINTIRMLVGHSKIQTTMGYAKDFYVEETDDAMKKLFDK